MLQRQRQRLRPRDHDIIVSERGREPSIFLSIPAQYALTNRRGADGKRSEFACRIVSISSRAATLIIPVNGEKGDWVVAHCDEFGRLEGKITRVLDRAFAMTIVATEKERDRLAAKIEGYEGIKNYDLSDRRHHKRIIPKDPNSILVFGDNTRSECFIIDVSTSGVAVSAATTPKIGTPLAVGTVVGRVVRHFSGGFAVQFIQLQNIDGLEQKLIQL